MNSLGKRESGWVEDGGVWGIGIYSDEWDMLAD